MTAITIRNFEEATIDELVAALEAADDFYHNSGEPIVDDNEYDIAKRYAYSLNPAHVYFTGVGSEVRGGKVKLPYQMGSLDQVYEGEIEEWVSKNDLSDETVLITDKLDGTSAMIIYGDDGELQIAYSRGNGIEGADITRHIRQIPSVPYRVNGPMVVRAEVIIPVEKFEAARTVQKSRSGAEYKNPRNMVAGIMNAKANSDEIYNHIHVVAYEVVGDQKSKSAQLAQLGDEGFLLPGYELMTGRHMNDFELTKLLNDRRGFSPYELDGIVLDVNDADARGRLNPTKSTLNPAYAVKYKVASADNVKNVRVLEVEWNVSKHGYLKPRVRIEPTELVGVTIQHATGFNAKFIKENSIGEGAIIKITRSGDVIPFILETLEPGNLELPEGEWTETGVDLIATSGAAADEAKFKQIVDFFASIDAPNLKEGSVRKLLDSGMNDIEDIINAEEIDFIVAMGKNGTKAFEGLRERLNNIYVHDFIGSTPFFGRGVGKRKFKKLFESVDHDQLLNAVDAGQLTHLVSVIESVEGFDNKTALKIVGGLDLYKTFLELVEDNITFVVPKITGVTMEGQNVVFTGFRDKALAAEVEANGGKVASGVSKKVTMLVAANPNSNSGKVKKARDYGIEVVGLDDFKQLL